ncbi:MAG: alpha/beta hydrolase [Chlorogloeopsis fritschii C42_A2020_084]|uniref:alpha/beta hydrolase n=1 Tax=Chlorogloeopsis fritschii TaxID=1124 RepID=UPI0019EB332E|nr:alpha/beta hydrolase [Chlorogloeopsis fritschii]MBF2007167.1 alpha/beta hydrolase [Chlorogloeopsis fritschii C42_A2020_084]
MKYPFYKAFYVIASVSTLLFSTSTFAAQRVVFTYNIFRESVSVDELTSFAETGEASPRLNYYLNQTSQDPQTVRNILTQELNASPVVLDRVLNNPIGEFLLDRISQTIRTPSNRANRQALRSAIVLSASKDNRVSLIDILQNYPTTEVYVEGDRLAATYNQLSILIEGLQNVLGKR